MPALEVRAVELLLDLPHRPVELVDVLGAYLVHKGWRDPSADRRGVLQPRQLIVDVLRLPAVLAVAHDVVVSHNLLQGWDQEPEAGLLTNREPRAGGVRGGPGSHVLEQRIEPAIRGVVR